jgi:hypothetical protein
VAGGRLSRGAGPAVSRGEQRPIREPGSAHRGRIATEDLLGALDADDYLPEPFGFAVLMAPPGGTQDDVPCREAGDAAGARTLIDVLLHRRMEHRNVAAGIAAALTGRSRVICAVDSPDPQQ